MTVGLYFGSFNPIHIGHLIIANHMAQHEDLDQVWIVVSPHNPHKEKKSLLANHHRLALARAAVEDNPKLRVSDVEMNLPQPSYTVNTLAHLCEKHPTYGFALIMGEDNMRSLSKWRNYEHIINHHKIYVYPRVQTIQETAETDSAVYQKGGLSHTNIVAVDGPIMKISSSFIRRSIKEKKDVRYLLSEPVHKYLDEMNFYKA